MIRALCRGAGVAVVLTLLRGGVPPLSGQGPEPQQADSDAAPRIAKGTTLVLRLTSAVSGSASTTDAAFTATVAAPLLQDGRIVIAPGTAVWGHRSRGGRDRQSRPVLQLRFDSLANAGTSVPVALRLTHVENARESVGSTGLIVGTASTSMLRTPTSWVSLLLGMVEPVAGAALLVESRIRAFTRGRPVTYQPGTDLMVVVDDDMVLKAWPASTPPPAVPMTAALSIRIRAWPVRASHAKGASAGDPLNVAFLGDSASIRAAFLAAGWDEPDKMNVRSDLVTFVRALQRRGYAHQPVSVQELDGRPPALVFQKVGNTFAQRHHVRIWRVSDDTTDVPAVYLAAATHDVGITFDTRSKRFTHRVDPSVDGERDKVVDDLWNAGCLAALSRVPRDLSDTLRVNNGRDRVVSDARMAVISLRTSCVTGVVH